MPEFRVRFVGDLGNLGQFNASIRSAMLSNASVLQEANRAVASQAIGAPVNPAGVMRSGLQVVNPSTSFDKYNNAIIQSGSIVQRVLKGYQAEVNAMGRLRIAPIFDDNYLMSFSKATNAMESYLRLQGRMAPIDQLVIQRSKQAAQRTVATASLQSDLERYAKVQILPETLVSDSRKREIAKQLETRVATTLGPSFARISGLSVTPGDVEAATLARKKAEDAANLLEGDAQKAALAALPVVPRGFDQDRLALLSNRLQLQAAREQMVSQRDIEAIQNSPQARYQRAMALRAATSPEGYIGTDASYVLRKYPKIQEDLIKKSQLGLGATPGTQQFFANAEKQGFTVNSVFRDMERNVTKVSGSIKGADGIMSEFGYTIDKNNKIVNTWGRSLSGSRGILGQTGRDLLKFTEWMIAATVVMTAFTTISGSFGKINELNANLTRFAITAKLTKQETGQMFEGLSKVAYQTATPITELVKAADDMALATRKANQSTQEWKDSILDLATAVGILTNIAGMDTVQATELLTASIKQLDLSANQVLPLLNQITAAAGGQANSITDIMQSLGTLSEAALEAGMTVPQQIASVQVISQVTGKSAEQVATAFKNLFGSIDSTGSIKKLQEFGIAVRDTEGNLRPFLDIYKDVEDAIRSGIIPEGRVKEVIKAMAGGPRRAPDASALLSNIYKVFDVEGIAMNASNEALIANAKILDTNQAKLTRFQNTWDITIFEKLNQTVTNLVSTLADLGTMFAQVFGAIPTQVYGLIAQLLAVVAVSTLLGKVWNMLGATTAFTNVGKGIGLMKGEMDSFAVSQAAAIGGNRGGQGLLTLVNPALMGPRTAVTPSRWWASADRYATEEAAIAANTRRAGLAARVGLNDEQLYTRMTYNSQMSPEGELIPSQQGTLYNRGTLTGGFRFGAGGGRVNVGPRPTDFYTTGTALVAPTPMFRQTQTGRWVNNQNRPISAEAASFIPGYIAPRIVEPSVSRGTRVDALRSTLLGEEDRAISRRLATYVGSTAGEVHATTFADKLKGLARNPSFKLAAVGAVAAGATAAAQTAGGPNISGMLQIAGTAGLFSGNPYLMAAGGAAIAVSTAMQLLGGSTEDLAKKTKDLKVELYDLQQEWRNEQITIDSNATALSKIERGLDNVVKGTDAYNALERQKGELLYSSALAVDAQNESFKKMLATLGELQGFDTAELSAKWGKIADKIRTGGFTPETQKELISTLSQEFLNAAGQATYVPETTKIDLPKLKFGAQPTGEFGTTRGLLDELASIGSIFDIGRARDTTGLATSQTDQVRMKDIVDNPALVRAFMGKLGAGTANFPVNAENVAYYQSGLVQAFDKGIISEKELTAALQELTNYLQTHQGGAVGVMQNAAAAYSQDVDTRNLIGALSGPALANAQNRAKIATDLAARAQYLPSTARRRFGGQGTTQQDVARMINELQANEGKPITKEEAMNYWKALASSLPGKGGKNLLQSYNGNQVAMEGAAASYYTNTKQMSVPGLTDVSKDIKEATVDVSDFEKAVNSAADSVAGNLGSSLLNLQAQLQGGQFKNKMGEYRETQRILTESLKLDEKMRSVFKNMGQYSGKAMTVLSESLGSTVNGFQGVGASIDEIIPRFFSWINVLNLTADQIAQLVLLMVELGPIMEALSKTPETISGGKRFGESFTGPNPQYAAAKARLDKWTQDMAALGKAAPGQKPTTGGGATTPEPGKIYLSDELRAREKAGQLNVKAFLADAYKDALKLQSQVPGADKKNAKDIVVLFDGLKKVMQTRGVAEEYWTKAIDENTAELKKINETKADTIRRIRVGNGSFAALANVPLNATSGVSVGSPQGPITVNLNINGQLMTPAQLTQAANLFASAAKAGLAGG